MFVHGNDWAQDSMTPSRAWEICKYAWLSCMCRYTHLCFKYNFLEMKICATQTLEIAPIPEYTHTHTYIHVTFTLTLVHIHIAQLRAGVMMWPPNVIDRLIPSICN
jgi:hypothetical protein